MKNTLKVILVLLAIFILLVDILLTSKALKKLDWAYEPSQYDHTFALAMVGNTVFVLLYIIKEWKNVSGK